ncbi:hypothetical protein AAC387_Pa08g2119 [Persea americana]
MSYNNDLIGGGIDLGSKRWSEKKLALALQAFIPVILQCIRATAYELSVERLPIVVYDADDETMVLGKQTFPTPPF